MKIFIVLYYLFLLSCNNKKEGIDEIEIIDTEMAEFVMGNNRIIDINPDDSLNLSKAHHNILNAIQHHDSVLFKNNTLQIITYKKILWQMALLSDLPQRERLGSIHNSIGEFKEMIKPFIEYLQMKNEEPRPFVQYQETDSAGIYEIDTQLPIEYSFSYKWRNNNLNYYYDFYYTKIEGKFKLVTIVLGETDPQTSWAFLFNDADIYYPKVKNSNYGLDSFHNFFYSRELKLRNEPRLFNNKGEDAIRFMWYFSAGYSIIIRLQKVGNNFFVINNVNVDIDLKKQPEDTIKISYAEWNEFLYGLNRNSFYLNQSSELPDYAKATDATNFILESRLNDAYHYINRPMNNDFNKIYLRFHKIAKLDKALAAYF